MFIMWTLHGSSDGLIWNYEGCSFEPSTLVWEVERTHTMGMEV